MANFSSSSLQPPSSSLLSWLFDQQYTGISLGLERMRELLEALGNPQNQVPCFHIAGTNGKGSVSAFSASLLKAAGLRVGLYTSPHLIDFRERIQINGEMISLENLEEGIRRLQVATKNGKHLPTFFELTTALAFDYFARQQCDLIVLETGLGGRLDATNLATNKIGCAITPISLDHQALLGSTLSAIAREKAGIMRPGVPVVTSPQHEEVLQVLKEEAARVGAPLEVISEPISLEIPLGLLGSYQRWNAALALKLIQHGPWKIANNAMFVGLKSVSWPGRFQSIKLSASQELILDGAHNPSAVEQLVATWKEVFPGQKCCLIFGSLVDKEGEKMLRILEPIAASINLVSVHSPRTDSPHDLQQIFPLASTFSSLKVFFKKKNFFLDKTSTFSENFQTPILLTGSLFLVGEALAILQRRPHAAFVQ